MKRRLILGGSLVLVLFAIFVLYRQNETPRGPESPITQVKQGEVKDGVGNAPETDPGRKANPVPIASASDSWRQAVRAADTAQASTPTQTRESAHSTNGSSLKRSDDSLEHQRVSKGLVDEYIGGMYTEEKIKAPMPEMAAVMHNQVNNEELDKDWGPATQQILETYWRAGLAPFGSDIDLTTVECKSKTCEVIGVIQNIDNKDLNGLMDRWNAIERQMPGQPWWPQTSLGQPQSEVAMGPNNSTLLFLYLFRQKAGK
jgi:hypothetical protein